MGMGESEYLLEHARHLVKITKGGRDNLYSLVRLPRHLADKYSLNQECLLEIIDREDLGGILIKKAS